MIEIERGSREGAEHGSVSLFIEPATNTEQLVSIRPVIVSFTQPPRVALCPRSAKWSSPLEFFPPPFFHGLLRASIGYDDLPLFLFPIFSSQGWPTSAASSPFSAS